MADRVREALARVVDAAAAEQVARAETASAVRAANAFARDPAALEAFARVRHPHEWNLIDAPDAPDVYTALNRHILAFEAQTNIGDDPAVLQVVRGESVVVFHAARALTGNRMRTKRSRIRLARKRARQQ